MTVNNVTKSVFITTVGFTKDAKNIVLIDGNKLTELFDKYDLGVREDKTYTVKQINQNFFEENNI